MTLVDDVRHQFILTIDSIIINDATVAQVVTADDTFANLFLEYTSIDVKIRKLIIEIYNGRLIETPMDIDEI